MFTNETPHIETIWYTAWDGRDLMAVLMKDDADGGWILRWRFKYYHSEQPFDDQDIQREYELRADDGTQEKADALTTVFNGIIQMANLRGDVRITDRFDVKGDGLAAVAALSQKPWCHMRVQSGDGTMIPMAPQPPLAM